MKLSNVLLTSMLLSATAVMAQDNVKRDTIKKVQKEMKLIGVKRRAISGAKIDTKVGTDTTKADTTKVIPISPDYCPPCGMG